MLPPWYVHGPNKFALRMHYSSRTIWTSILFFLFIVTPGALFAQGKFTVNGRLKMESGDLSDARAVVYKDGVKERTITSGLNKFSLDLELNANYIVSFEKEGYVSKKISFNTKAPAEAISGGFTPFDYAVSLFKQYDDVNIVVFNQPVGLIRYDERSGDFDYDTDYTKSIQSQLQQVLEEVDKKQKEEENNEKEKAAQAAVAAKAQAKAEAEAAKQAAAKEKADAEAAKQAARRKRRPMQKPQRRPKPLQKLPRGRKPRKYERRNLRWFRYWSPNRCWLNSLYESRSHQPTSLRSNELPKSIQAFSVRRWWRKMDDEVPNQRSAKRNPAWKWREPLFNTRHLLRLPLMDQMWSGTRN
jgi:flagellar biosynthesis GTPase FlhF